MTDVTQIETVIKPGLVSLLLMKNVNFVGGCPYVEIQQLSK